MLGASMKHISSVVLLVLLGFSVYFLVQYRDSVLINAAYAMGKATCTTF